MLEGIASSILTKYLGDYIEGLDKNNLNISITSGDAVLTNMRLKKSALKDLELPVEVKEGFLRKLTLKIPWKSIGSQPAIIKIEGVYIIASPKKGSRDSIEEEKNRKHASKLQQLQLAELLGLDKPSEDEPKKKEKKDEGFFARLTMKVVDNIQIYIDNIHIRYEDEISNPKNPFTVGITLDRLYAQSTDENWKPTFLTVGADIVHKLVTLSNLAIYFNTSKNDQFLKFSTVEEMATKMEALIPNDENQNDLGHHYILKPISGVLKAQIDRGDEIVMDRPKIFIQSELESFKFSINSSQFKRIMDVSNYVEKFYKILEHIEHKPPSFVRPKDNPIAWWKYAYECFVHKAKKKREAWKWENIEKFINYRTSYIKLYKEQIRVTAEKMKPAARKEIEELERILSYDDIITFRKLAYASFKKDELKNKERGFFSRFFGSKPAEIEENKTAALKELYDAIGYDQSSSEQSKKESPLPPEYVKMRFDFHMNIGSFELGRDDKNKSTPLGSFNFHNLHSSMLLRENWKTFKGNLEKIEFIEYHTLNDRPLTMLEPDVEKTGVGIQDFMTVQVDINPLNVEKPLDFLLKIDSKPLYIYFSKSFIDTLVDFFKIESSDNIEKITQAASAGFDNLKKRAETGLKYTIDQKKKMMIDIHLDAPKVICPKDFNDAHSPSVVLDLGRIHFTSNPYSNEKGIEKKDDKEITVSEDYFYDQFDIIMEGLNALVIYGEETTWKNIKELNHKRYSIVDRFDFDVILKVCNEQSSELPKVKVSSSIKSVSLNITQAKVSAMFEVIDSITASPPKPKELPEKIETPIKVKGTAPKTIRGSKRIKKRVVDLEAPKPVETTRKKKEEVYSQFLDLDFELGSFSARLYEFREISNESQENQQPLATFNMEMLHFKFKQSKFDLKVEMSLKSISIKDRGQDQNYLLMTEQDDSNVALIDINYIGIPQSSPLYKDVDHEMDVKLGKIILNVNRPTVAGLLQTINNLSASLKKSEQVVPKEEEEVTEEDVKETKKSEIQKDEKPHSIYKLQASLYSVQINLNRKSDTFAKFTLNKSLISIDVKNDNNLFIEGYLGSISLYDPYVLNKWSNLISVEGSNEMVKFSFSKYDKKSIDYPGYDMELDLKMNSLKYVFLNKTIKELSDYFSGFERMRSIISAASYYYYSASIDAIKDAAKNVTKVKFNIEIRNPQIIVPLSSQNKDHLVLNLGNMHLNNSFVENCGNEIDNIRVRIINFNTQSNIFNSEINTFDKDDIILNTNTEVLVERALYPEEVKERAEIDIKMNIPSFGITISESQITLLLSMLSQNIGEEVKSEDDEEMNLVIEALKSVDFDVEKWKYEQEEKEELNVIEELEKKMKIRLQFRLSNVYLKALRGNGYEKDSNLQDEVFQLKVNKILSEALTYNDSSLYFKVELSKAYLEDTRNKTDILFKRIWAPKDDTQRKMPQFSFIYETKPSNHFTSMKTTLYQPQLTLVPETLIEVYQYLMRNLEKLSPPKNKDKELKQQDKEEKEGEEKEDKRSIMKIEVSIVSPEICVVENAYIQQTPSFVLHLGNSSLNMSTSSDTMKLGLSLDSFDMYRCVLDSNDLKVRKDISKVLQPISIEANLGRNEDGIKKISADLGIINTIISFSDIKRLLIIYKSFLPLIETFSSQPENPDIESLKEIEEEKPLSIEEKKEEIEKVEETNDEELIQLADDEPTEVTEIEDEDKGPIDTQVIVSLKSIYMTLLNDRISSNSYPALKLSIENNEAMVTLYKEGGQEVYFTVETLEMSSYNNLVAAIEPVIEPWSMNLVYEKFDQYMKVHVEAQEVLDINITKSLLDTLFTIQELIKEINGEVWKGKKEEKMDVKQVYFDPYIVRNQTLSKISFVTSNIKSPRQVIGPNEETSLITSPSNRNVSSERPTKYYIDVEFPDNPNLEPIKNIPVSKVAKNYYTLKGYDSTAPLIVDVEDSHGTKIITFRSSMVVKNEFKESIEFAINDKFADSIVYTAVIKPNESFNVPINMISNSIFLFRPHNKDYSWCKLANLNVSKEYYCLNEKTNSLWICSLLCNLSTLYRYGINTVYDKIITIRPALTIENLLCTDLSIRLKEKNSDFIAFEHEGLKPMEELDIYEFNHSDSIDFEELNSDFTLGGKYTLEIKFKGFNWSTGTLIKDKDFRLELKDMNENPLKLDVECKLENGLRNLAIHAPYWIINHTGLDLFYKKPKSSKEAAGQRVLSDSYTSKYADNEADPSTWYDDDLYTIYYDYSENRFMYDDKRICIRVGDSLWSKDVPLGLKNEGLISIQDKEKTHREYQFIIKVEPAPGKFWRTKLVRLYPANIIVNKTSTTLLYKQSSTSYVYKINEEQSIPFHWPSYEDKNKRISFADGSEENAWTPEISIQNTGSFRVKMRTIYTESDRILDVIIKVIDGVTFIIIGDGTKDVTKVISYKIVNRSDYDVVLEQKDSPTRFTLGSKEETIYCWDEPQFSDPRLLVSVPNKESKNNKKIEIDLDVITNSNDIQLLNVGNGRKLKFEVRADGDTKTLVISNLEDIDEVNIELKRVLNFQLTLSMRGIGVSIIDETPQELLYITFQTIYFDFQTSNIDKTLEFSIGTAQIDNQLYNNPIPILLYSITVDDSPFFHLSLIQNTTTERVQFFKYFAVKLQEIDLNIDESLIIRMLAFLESFIEYFYNLDQEEKVDKLLNDVNHDIPKIKDEDISSLNIYYFEIFHINPIRVNVTYMANPVHDDISLNAVQVQKILGYIGKLTNIEKAPLELNCLILEHPYCSKEDLIGRVITHYTNAAIRQAYLILGSADFLGNPVSLFTNIGTGFKDFFYEPAKGIVKSPKDFGVGLAKGTKSLLKKTIYGLFDTASKLTGTVAKVGTNLTFDSEYQKERSIRNQTKARHAGEGLAYGVRDFGIGLFKGITGVVVQPIKGVKKEGALGFFKGVGKGVAGIVLKPTIGAVDLITRTTEGIKNTTTYFDEKLKIPIRPPRYISDDGVVGLYNFEKSLGLQIFKSLDSSKLKYEKYYNHVLLEKGKFLMTTTQYILLIEQAIIRLGHKWVIEWKAKITDIIDIQIDEKGKALYLIEKKSSDKNITRKIPCSNVEETRLCYQALIQTGVYLPSLDENKKKDVETMLGHDIFEVSDEDEIDDFDLDAKRQQRQRQRKQKYANERTKLLGGGDKHETCAECCDRCCDSCTIQ